MEGMGTMFAHAEHVEDGSPLSQDESYAGPGWYAADMNGLVSGPFDDADECDWWLSKALRV